MQTKLPTLFARDSKGRGRMWSVHTEGENVVVTHGLIDGKKQTKITTAKAKNIGKVNETTPEEQAILEAQSKWTHQVEREDYNMDINNSGLQVRPMLALDYRKVPHRVRWDVAVAQPKLNGLRLTAGNRFVPGGWNHDDFEQMTRKGETYKLRHLTGPSRELLKIVNELCDNRCIALDGEAYVAGMKLQLINSRAKKYQVGLTEELQYHMFDLIIPGMTFQDRHALLVEALVGSRLDRTLMQTVPYRHILDETDLKKVHGAWTLAGYEGAMIRHLDSEYSIADRSADLFKYKEFQDKECKIIGMWKDGNGNAMLTCLWDHNKPETVFDLTPKRTHKVRKEMLVQEEEYIGKWITVQYQELTMDNLPEFPVGLDLRDCDENGNPLR